MSGPPPLTVRFDASGSSDPDHDALTYAWDLDGDGQYDDSTAEAPQRTYNQAASVTVRLRVSDGIATGTASRIIVVGRPPTAVIDTPASSLTWAVGDTISFSGHATSDIDGPMPAADISWQIVILHCPSNCHEHVLQTFDGVKSGSFAAPDHSYPSALVLRMTARDSAGLQTTTSVTIQPKTVTLSLRTDPAGGTLILDTTPYATPADVTVIKGSGHTVGAETPQQISGTNQTFVDWSGVSGTRASVRVTGASAIAVQCAPPSVLRCSSYPVIPAPVSVAAQRIRPGTFGPAVAPTWVVERRSVTVGGVPSLPL